MEILSLNNSHPTDLKERENANRAIRLAGRWKNSRDAENIINDMRES